MQNARLVGLPGRDYNYELYNLRNHDNNLDIDIDLPDTGLVRLQRSHYHYLSHLVISLCEPGPNHHDRNDYNNDHAAIIEYHLHDAWLAWWLQRCYRYHLHNQRAA